MLKTKSSVNPKLGKVFKEIRGLTNVSFATSPEEFQEGKTGNIIELTSNRDQHQY